MTAYYTPSGAPTAQGRGVSSSIRAEFVLIQTAFGTVLSDMAGKGALTGATWTGTHDFSGATLVKLSASTLYGAMNAGGYVISNAGNASAPGDLVNLQTAQALLSGGGTPANIPITSLGKGTAAANQLIRVNAAGTAIEGTLVGSAYQLLRVNAAGTALEGRPTWLRKTTTYTAVSFDRIKCSTTGGGWSLTFPPTPSDGDEVEIQDVDGTFHTNNLTILANGKKVMGDSTSFVCDTRYMNVAFVYDATLGDWRF